jgi:hypothetical protein
MKISKLGLIITIFLISYVSFSQSKSGKDKYYWKKYIGTLRHHLPDSLQPGIYEKLDDPYFIEAISKTKHGPPIMFWFEKRIPSDSSHVSGAKILDVVEVPKMKKNWTISLRCWLNDTCDSYIIAIDEWHGNETWCEKIIYAWRANRLTEKLEKIPIEGIKTLHEGIGG